MKRSIAALIVLAMLVSGASFIPGNTSVTVQTPITGTIAIGGTFQKVLDADTTRKGCVIPNVSTHTLLVFAVPPAGSIADATALKSLPVAPSGSFNCAAPGGGVVTNEIDITTSTSTDLFLVWFTR